MIDLTTIILSVCLENNAYDWEDAARSPFTTETSTDDKVPGVGDIGLEENLEDIDDTDNVKSASEH
jgi:hypothetical protein